ncbi:MAG: hypothetical protein IPG45_34255 [Deltaproteobacteria bacterium]|nr:hypothetical protein [Deltaproteobacteria bacterium]
MSSREFGVLREENADLLTVGRVMGGLSDLGLTQNNGGDSGLLILAVGTGPGDPTELLEAARRHQDGQGRVLIIAHPAGLPRAEELSRQLGADYALAGAVDGFRFRRPGAVGVGESAAELTQFLGHVTAGV